jgi:cytidine deaminase
MNREIKLAFEEFAEDHLLKDSDRALVLKAREATATAYAPYSNFRVAAAARLQDGSVHTATNQENASYPVGICAERSLLALIGAMFPGAAIEAMAIAYHNPNGKSDKPVAPCGMCRQALLEYENRTTQPIRLLLTGYSGKVLAIEKASSLLPLSFSGEDLL